MALSKFVFNFIQLLPNVCLTSVLARTQTGTKIADTAVLCFKILAEFNSRTAAAELSGETLYVIDVKRQRISSSLTVKSQSHSIILALRIICNLVCGTDINS